ncbi:protein kinase domain-containing protein [Fervidibacillus halotolerans]|uniref:Protein kinase n=1 Tax=Fervidibacillus halotolerans TaxID=2980027 RepID=A0A9E8LYY1_9BACI|nr:protein kinase [Fervidibacillus halotolerans]WAA12353.1 protein kinase [Fervidibacillus halotolerans]
MAMNTLKSPFNIPNGRCIEGKWHKNRYKIQKELGRGANGVVYLAEWKGRKVAVKISDNHLTITSETNVLKALSKAQGIALGPSLLDVDDWEIGSRKFSFYAMEYIEGEHFLQFIKRKGMVWLDILILQLLSDLQSLHERGWIFGDLKPDNLIVTPLPVKIRCIDVGGTTAIGRSIKEFTEFFDRGYWGLGSRRAEPSYDLFSVAMIIVNAYYPDRFPKKIGGIQQLQKMIVQKNGLHKYEPILLRALTGKYHQAKEMRLDLLTFGQKKIKKNQPSRPLKAKVPSNPPQSKQKRTAGWLETIFIFLIISLFYSLYIFGQIG